MKKSALGLSLVLVGLASVASAGSGSGEGEIILKDICKADKYLDNTPACKSVLAPEIDPASAMAGLTMLLGGVAVVRGRRAKNQ